MTATKPSAQTTTTPKPRPAPITDYSPRCTACGRSLAGHLTRPWSLRCRKCHAPNARS